MSDNGSSSTLKQNEQAFGLRQLLNIRDFRLVWFAQAISDFGDSLTSLALLILINQITGSAAAIATMLIVLTIPQITFGLVAGVYVDRLDRKRIMIFSDLLRGLLVLGFIVVGSRDNFWLLYVIGFVQASIGTLFTPARSALMPNIVPASGLLAANSISQTSRIISNLLGTAAAGVLIGISGIYWPAFTVDALTFFVSVLLVSRIAIYPRVEIAPGQAKASPRVIFSQLTEGMGLIAHTPALAGTLVAAAVTMLGLGAVNVLLVPLIVNDLQVPTTWFGVVDLAQTVSMVLSGSLIAILASRFLPTRIISVALIIVGVAVGSIAGISNVWQLLIILFVVGWAVTPLQASISTLVQTSVSDSARGRISASLNTLVSTASLLSMALAGALGQAIGVRNVFVVGGIVVVLAGVASAWVFRGYKAARSDTTATESESPAPIPVATGTTN